MKLGIANNHKNKTEHKTVELKYMKRAWQNFTTQLVPNFNLEMDHYRAGSPEISGLAIEYFKKLTIIMR